MAENLVMNYSNIELARAKQAKADGKGAMMFNSSFSGVRKSN
jgi:hypothetical protein